jgi:hypothetical protein
MEPSSADPSGEPSRSGAYWHVPNQRPSPAYTTRAFIACGLAVLWFFGLPAGLFDPLRGGDCYPESCAGSDRLASERFWALIIILVVVTLASAIAGAFDRPGTYLVLVVLSSMITAVAVISYVNDMVGVPIQPPHPLSVLFPWVAPGSTVLLGAALAGARRTLQRKAQVPARS